MSKTFRLSKIADFLDAKLYGDPDCIITGIAALDQAVSGQISFLENPSYRKYLSATKASAVILSKNYLSEVKTSALIVAKPYLCYAKLSAWFNDAPAAQLGIHTSAIIGEGCDIDSSVCVGPYAILGKGVTVGKNVRIGSHVVIGDEVAIGDDCTIYPNVTIYHHVTIGKRVTLHSGVVIGADGFGNANDKGVWHKIYQLGSVNIGDDCEVGANTTIDRGALDDTIIENGVKLDNQIQIGHNVKIGAHTAIAGCVGIAGSTTIGKHCMIAGGVGISGHITIADGVIITGMTGVGKSITLPGVYSSGIPAVPTRSWFRTLTRINQLENIVHRISELEKKIDE